LLVLFRGAVALLRVVSISEGIFGLILKKGRLYASGQGVIRVLPVSTTASVIKLFTLTNRSQMFVRDARRLSADWMHSIDIYAPKARQTADRSTL